MPGFSVFVLNLSKSGNVLFRSVPNGNCLFSSASLSLVREITHWSMSSDGSCWTTCECNICPTSCTEISFWKKPVSIGGKLCYSYRKVFELAQGLRDFKTKDLDCSYEALVQKEAFVEMSREGICTILCVLLLSTRKEHPCMRRGRVKPLLLFHTPNIHAVIILLKTGKSTALKDFINCF